MHENTERTIRPPYFLILVFIILVAGIISGGYVYFTTYKQSYRVEAEKQLSAITNLKVKELEKWRSERFSDAQIVYGNKLFSQVVGRFLHNPADAESRQTLLFWLDKLTSSNPEYFCTFLLDAQCRLQVSDSCEPFQNQTFIPRQAAEALQTGEIRMLDLYRCEIVGHIHMIILVPIFGGPDGSRPLGVIGLIIDPKVYLYPLLKNWPTSSRTAETLIVRHEGDDVLFLNELKFRKGSALTHRIPLSNSSVPAVKAVLGQVGLVEGFDYNGVRVIADVVNVPDSPWFMVARMASDELYKPLNTRFWDLILLVTVLIFVTGLGLVVFWRQQRLRFYRSRLEITRQSEQQLRSVLDVIPFPVVVVDQQYTNINFWSRSAQVLFGHTPTTTAEWYALAYPDPDYRCEVIARLKPFLERARFSSKPANAGEYLVTCSDGSVRICELHVAFISDSLIVIFHDITGRKQAEMKLSIQAKISEIFLTEDDEEMFDRVLKVLLEVMESPFGVFGYLDEDGALIVPTMMRNILEKCQVKDKNSRFPRDTWGDSSWPRAIREKKHNISNEPSRKVPDGHVAIQRHITMPIMIGNTVVGIFQFANKQTDYIDDDIKILQNIADHIAPILAARLSRDEHEKNLQERNDELAQFSYAVSHDLKSPLVTIRTFLGYLEKDLQKHDIDRIAKDFMFMRSATDKMSLLLDELLDMIRVGRIEKSESMVSLQDIVQEALTLVAGRVVENGVTVEITPQPLMLRGDRVRLVEVFQNLIDNAVKFMGEQSEPRVDIGWQHKDGHDILFVRDNGMGINPKYLKKIFNLFEKIDSGDEGTGIGLALVKRIVEVHGGRIWVESDGLGKGVCFWFSLSGEE